MTRREYTPPKGSYESRLMARIDAEATAAAEENADRSPVTDARYINEWGIETSRQRRTLRNLPGATQCPDQAEEMATRHHDLFFGTEGDGDGGGDRGRRGRRGRRRG